MSIKLTAPRTNLLAAATVSAVLAALACISTASAQTAGSSPNAKADLARCQQLFSTRSHYHANGSEPSAQDTEAEMALQQCKTGHADAGIATLEAMLRAKNIPVPPAEATAQSR
jgi:hypothetical protein